MIRAIKIILAIAVVFLFGANKGHCQTSITIDASTTYQTMEGFGASGAWTMDPVGEYWSDTEKEKLAKYLFSKELDGNGNPEGIGLSRWRFNIGAGSYELGDNSRVSKPERRVECFMTSFNASNGDATYDWDKQSGQQWFLNKAHEYGVEHLVAFTNSAPYFMNKNGQTNMDSDDWYASTNLKTEHYDDFAEFLVTVLEHFENSGIHFSEISPINEPQWGWEGGNEGQEGCPYKNEEAAAVVRELDAALTAHNLDAKISLSESGKWTFLSKTNADGRDPAKQDQIRDYFDPMRTDTYVGNLDHIMPGLASHSYWVNEKNDNGIKSTREEVRALADSYGINLYQSEYCLLGGGDHYDDYWLNTLYLAKIIQSDLVFGEVKFWDFWTAAARERWDQKNRFYLVPLKHTSQGGGVHNYTDLTQSGGYVGEDKNLWAMGQFSRFVHPDYTRVDLSNANILSGLFGSAYFSAENHELVVVYVNSGDNSVDAEHNLTNLPDSLIFESMTPYITDQYANNLTRQTVVNNTDYAIPGKSVVTLVIQLEALEVDCHGDVEGDAYYDSCEICVGGNTGNSECVVTSKDEKTLNSRLEVIPNPVSGLAVINGGAVNWNLYDIYGQHVLSGHGAELDVSKLSAKMYLLNADGRYARVLVK